MDSANRLEAKGWEWSVENAEHYLALGTSYVYLGRDEQKKPWHLVAEVSGGGSHRLDIDTSVRFAAPHPCGLTFGWCEDIEDRGADGCSAYKIDIPKLLRILDAIPAGPRAALARHLAAFSSVVLRNAEKWEAVAAQERETARFLEDVLGSER